MPSRASPLWWLTAFILVAFPVLNFIYWPMVLQSGVLPSDGDSISIPMFGSILAMLVVSPFVIGVAWLCLQRYNPDTRLWSWRQDRLFRSVGTTMLFGTASVALTAIIMDSVRLTLPWYEYLWSAYFSCWLPWLLAMRAAALDQLDYMLTYSER